MLELDNTQFHRVTPLTAGKIRYPESESVIAGHSPGRVFVDQSQEPQLALVWVQGQAGFYLLGAGARQEFLQDMEQVVQGELRPFLKAQGISSLEFSGDDPAWNPLIERTFAKRDLQSEPQAVYLLTQPRWKRVADRSRAVPIDATLLNSLAAGEQLLTTKLLDCWQSYDRFLENGLGNCCLVGEQVVSFCFSGYVAGRCHAIVVETLPEWRQQGLAKLATAALLEQCQQRDVVPHWDVMPTNTGSILLAEGLGFTKAYEYQVYCFSI